MNKKLIVSFLLASVCWFIYAQDLLKEQAGIYESFNILLATDLGQNGGYDQKPVAEWMGKTAEEIPVKFIVTSGDTHHYLGVESTADPLWFTNFELIYSHPALQVRWFPVLGNHEYEGNTQAVIDYSNVSRRWCMPDRYYTHVHNVGGESIRMVYIDTPPLIDRYRNDTTNHPDAGKQDMDKQLAWLDSVLQNSTEKWKVVIGHHPVYSETPKDDSERTDLQNRVEPILSKHKVDMYICGHIHNFQHIKPQGSAIDYIVNSSGSLSRNVNPIEGTKFCSPEAGFSVLSVTNEELKLYMINTTGKIIYTMKRQK